VYVHMSASFLQVDAFYDINVPDKRGKNSGLYPPC
jgi:hypothetical protein